MCRTAAPCPDQVNTILLCLAKYRSFCSRPALGRVQIASPTVTTKAVEPLVGLAVSTFAQLTTPHWLSAIAAHMRSSLDAQLRTHQMPQLAAALQSLHAAFQGGVIDQLETKLLAALEEVASTVVRHLALIDAVIAAVRQQKAAHMSAVSLDKVVSLREAYLEAVAAKLQPADGSEISLQQVCIAARL